MESHSLTSVECKIEKKVDTNDLESLPPITDCRGVLFIF